MTTEFGKTVADAIAFSTHANQVLMAVRSGHGLFTYVTMPPGVFRDLFAGIVGPMASEYEHQQRELTIGSHAACSALERERLRPPPPPLDTDNFKGGVP